MFSVNEGKDEDLRIRLSSDLGLVDRAVDVVGRYLARRGVADPFEITLVTRELLNNAVEHGNRGDPSRRVTCEVGWHPSDRIGVTVTDEGVGFDPSTLSMRLPASPLNDRHRGFGLIHAFSDRVIFNKTGNAVTALLDRVKIGETRRGETTEVQDPASRIGKGTGKTEFIRPAGFGKPRGSGSRMTADRHILIAEDSRVSRKMEVEMLREIGYVRLTEAGDGDEAVVCLERDPAVDLIISDWNMPGRDGLELLEWVRAHPTLRNVPFLMATAHGERDQAERATGAGVTGFLTKPFAPEELAAAVARAFGETDRGPKFVPAGSAARSGPRRNPRSGVIRLNVAHLQITDHLVLGVARHLAAADPPRHFELIPRCMSSWNPVADALSEGRVEAACILAPIAMDRFGAGADIRVVLFAHKNGSACVVRPRTSKAPDGIHPRFAGRSVFIPHILSVQHKLMDLFLREAGLRPGLVGRSGANVFFEVAPPIRMPRFLRDSPEAAGFIVAEPVASGTAAGGEAEILFRSGEIWENHPCCVLAVRREVIDDYPEAVDELVRLLVRAGRQIADHPRMAAEVALGFLDPDGEMGWTVALIERVLRDPNGLRTDDLYPVTEDLKRIGHYMANEMGIGSEVDLDRLVDRRFADAACPVPSGGRYPSTFHGCEAILSRWDGGGGDDHPAAPPSRCEPVVEPPDSAFFEITERDDTLKVRLAPRPAAIDRVLKLASRLTAKNLEEPFEELTQVLRELLVQAAESDPAEVTCAVYRVTGDLYGVSVTGGGLGHFGPDDTGSPLDWIRHLCEQMAVDPAVDRMTVYLRPRRETRYEITEGGDIARIRPTGSITAASAETLKGRLLELLDAGWTRFHFDFAAVEEVDSVSLTLFVVFVKTLNQRGIGGELTIAHTSENIRKLFRMTRLDQYYTLD